MPHRLARHEEHTAKRRQLIWLSTASTLLIIMLWIFYMQRTFSVPTPADDRPAQTDSVSVFKNGFSRIATTIETGLVNSYLYFHTVASEEKTFTITK
ncbi:MAG: hypothetical protein Q7R63_01120 [bacterium]|nr:hypothetical protein [bacterium]